MMGSFFDTVSHVHIVDGEMSLLKAKEKPPFLATLHQIRAFFLSSGHSFLVGILFPFFPGGPLVKASIVSDVVRLLRRVMEGGAEVLMPRSVY